MCIPSQLLLLTPGQMVVYTGTSPSRSLKGKQLLPDFPASTDWAPETLCTQEEEAISFIHVFMNSFQQDLLRASQVPSTVVDTRNIIRNKKEDTHPLTSVHSM